MGGNLPSKPGRTMENPDVAVDELEKVGEICPTMFCQVGDPMGAKSVVAVKPAGETKDGVKTGRGSGLGTGEGRVDRWIGGGGPRTGRVPKGIGGGGPPRSIRSPTTGWVEGGDSEKCPKKSS